MNALLAMFGLGGDRLPQASGIATQVDSIIEGLLIAGTAVVVVLGVLTAYVLIRYRKRSRALRKPVGMATWKIETGWTIVTLAVFLYFFVRGATVYLAMERMPVGAEVIHVVGRQWMWDIRYQDGRREFNALHLRQNVTVRFVLSSEDVIHSFFVPAFRLKQDVVPGRVASAWVTPTRVGTYTLFCAQYCGTAHAEMIGTVVVLAPAAYEAWRRSPGAPAATAADSPIDRGQKLYLKYGCGVCHEDPSATRAPALVGLYDSQVPLQGGKTIRADEEYLDDAIRLAPKYVVAGYAPGMPTYAGIISEPETLDLISYLETLRSPNAPAIPRP